MDKIISLLFISTCVNAFFMYVIYKAINSVWWILNDIKKELDNTQNKQLK